MFCDVFGFDPDLLAMIPQPCIALLLLFPINEKVGVNHDFVELPLLLLCCSFILCRSESLRRKKRLASKKMDK